MGGIDIVAQGFEQLGCDRNGSLAIGVRRNVGRPVEHPDAQTAGIRTDLVEEWTSKRWRDVRVTGLVARNRIEHRGGVAHAACDAAVDRRAGPRLADQWSLTDPTAAGLQATIPAATAAAEPPDDPPVE